MSIIKSTFGRALKFLVGTVLVSVFLWFVYSYSPAGPWIREQVEILGEEVLGDVPPLPDLGGDRGEEVPAEDGGEEGGAESPSEDPVVGALEAPSDSAWISSAPTRIDTAKLDSLTIADPYSPYDYDRELFGQAWADVDRNGCDTRNDILARDLADVTYKPGTRDCVVQTGTLGDPYTGNVLEFTKGGTSQVIDIEHIVALEDAWNSGAWEWSDEERLAFANDPRVLAVVDGPTNREKGSDSISEWLPPYEGSHCAYGASYVEIAAAYDLSISEEDHAALEELSAECA